MKIPDSKLKFLKSFDNISELIRIFEKCNKALEMRLLTSGGLIHNRNEIIEKN